MDTIINEPYPMNLLHTIYGKSDDVDANAKALMLLLEQYIAKNCTNLERKTIDLRYRQGMPYEECLLELQIKRPAFIAFEHYIIEKLQHIIPPAPIPIPLNALRLPNREYNALRRANIHTVADIERLPPDMLLKLHGVGKKTIRVLREHIDNAKLQQQQLIVPNKIDAVRILDIIPHCHECYQPKCTFNRDGLCRYALIHERKPPADCGVSYILETIKHTL